MAVSTGLVALLVITWSDGGESFEQALARGSGELIRPSYDGDPGVVSDAAQARGRWM
jgi:hypothetical protein